MGPFLLSIGIVLYIVESWWATQLDSSYTNKFSNFAVGIGHPIFLYVLVKLLDPELFNDKSLISTNLSIFSIVFSISMIYVVFIRCKFHGMGDFFNHNWPRFFGAAGGIIFFTFFYNMRSSQEFSVCGKALTYLEACILIFGLGIFLIKRRSQDIIIAKVIKRDFVNLILPPAKTMHRRKFNIAFILINKRNKDHFYIKNEILTQFRKDTQIAIGKQGIYQLFLPDVSNLIKFEAKMRELKKGYDKILSIAWTAKQLSFVEYEDKKEIPDTDELRKTMNRIFDETLTKLKNFP